MSNSNIARTALDMFAVALDAFDALEQVIDVAGPRAETTLATVRAIVARVRAGFDGKAQPADIEHEIKALTDALGINDRRADSALDAKFRGE